MVELSRVRTIVERARNLSEPERHSFIVREAGDDAELISEVLARLSDEATALQDLDTKVSLESNGSSGDGSVLDAIRNRAKPASRYQFVAAIERGGMGEVSKVFDPDLRRHLAMKRMLDEKSASLPRFLEEAQVMGQLDHPNIVPVHELGIDERGRVFFTMKLVKGETLREVFERVAAGAGDWNVTRALSVILRVCEAMGFAHAKGVLHRDIKPGNIMVGRFGEVYVMDWGLARVLGRPETRDLRVRSDNDLSVVNTERQDKKGNAPSDSPMYTMDGSVIGTPSYMSPEQAEGFIDRIGPRSDVYAVGALLYRLLAGREPYAEPGLRLSGSQIVHRVIAGPPQPLHEFAKNVPAELLAIQEKAMARRIEDRYPSMDALADDLRAYLEHRVVSAYETGALAELKKWVGRNKRFATAAGLLLMVLAGATVLVSQQKREVDSKNVALRQANEEVTSQKAAVENQKQIAEAKIREFDQLAGKVYLERAITREKELHPPWPEKVEAMERWLSEDAKRLFDLKPTLEQTLTDLRTRALPSNDEDLAIARSTPPISSEIDSLRRQLAWLRTRIGVLESGERLEIPTVPAALQVKRAIELNEYAWKRVDPDFAKRLFGEELLALAAVRRAVARIEAGDATATLSSTLDTLAWACLANGLDAEARAASARAVDVVPEEKKAEYRSYSEKLEKAIAAYSGEAGANQRAALELKIAALEADKNTSRVFTFALESETFLYSALSELSASIAAFESGAKVDVEQRLSWAKQIGDLTLHHKNARVTWEAARAAILKADDVVASKLYAFSPDGPIDLRPQSGLVPIGMNPVTKLWEFYDLRSACDVAAGQDPATLEIPTHREDGSIEVKDGTGIVFVLLPGGTFLQGAQASNENAPNFDLGADTDEWPQEVTLAPFFLARHELTRGQWYRLSEGEEPSTNARNNAFPNDPPIGWGHPVESVAWSMCHDLFTRHGMTLPTEARWEYGARGGTSTVWWTGDEPSSLASAANLLDLRATRANPTWGNQIGDFDDGFVGSCRVGSLRANPFGLFDVHGNVWEWCLDTHQGHYGPARSGDGLRTNETAGPVLNIYRGGSYFITAAVARSADRNKIGPSARNAILGARPARDLKLASD